MEASAERRPYIDVGQLRASEYFGFVAATVLGLSLFLPWFSTSDTNPNSDIDGQQGELTAWDTYAILDYMLLAACIAPFILAFIIARGHKLSWRPGEVTAIVGIAAFGLIICNGIILGKPGDSVEVSFEIGYLVGVVGSAGIIVSGFLRQLRGTKKKPPGV